MLQLWNSNTYFLLPQKLSLSGLLTSLLLVLWWKNLPLSRYHTGKLCPYIQRWIWSSIATSGKHKKTCRICKGVAVDFSGYHCNATFKRNVILTSLAYWLSRRYSWNAAAQFRIRSSLPFFPVHSSLLSIKFFLKKAPKQMFFFL